jgi:hypothetical protein
LDENKKEKYIKFNKNLGGKNMSKIKDGFEYAMNWKRVFIDLYRNLEWLNSFAELNELAMYKISKKFTKNYFSDPNNQFKSELKQYIQTKQISNRKNLKMILENLYTFFVLHLAEGDQKKARDLIKNKDNKMRHQDAVQISFYGGGISVLVFVASFFLYVIN